MIHGDLKMSPALKAVKWLFRKHPKHCIARCNYVLDCADSLLV